MITSGDSLRAQATSAVNPSSRFGAKQLHMVSPCYSIHTCTQGSGRGLSEGLHEVAVHATHGTNDEFHTIIRL